MNVYREDDWEAKAEILEDNSDAENEGEKKPPCEYGYYTPDSTHQRCKHPEAYGWKCCIKVCQKLPNPEEHLECADCLHPDCEILLDDSQARVDSLEGKLAEAEDKWLKYGTTLAEKEAMINLASLDLKVKNKQIEELEEKYSIADAAYDWVSERMFFLNAKLKRTKAVVDAVDKIILGRAERADGSCVISHDAMLNLREKFAALSTLDKNNGLYKAPLMVSRKTWKKWRRRYALAATREIARRRKHNVLFRE